MVSILLTVDGTLYFICSFLHVPRGVWINAWFHERTLGGLFVKLPLHFLLLLRYLLVLKNLLLLLEFLLFLLSSCCCSYFYFFSFFLCNKICEEFFFIKLIEVFNGFFKIFMLNILFLIYVISFNGKLHIIFYFTLGGI